ncbi:MAG: STAS domain-containing protein [Desulfobulbaceae bacterium]|nr:STAS domain-containing protein [Desulfobulbaceae bacterium]
MLTKIENKDDIFIVTLNEERLDAALAPEFEGKMQEWIQSGKTAILLDLTPVDFIDSTGLGTLVSSLKAIDGSGQLVLCGISLKIMSLFKLTRMDRVFTIFPNRDEALASFLPS